MQRFDLAAIVPTPWKNGGGATREIVCWPPGAGMDGFGWRVSAATIDRAGPFSAYPGIQRQIMLLDGDGVHLRAQGIDHRLDEPWQPWSFDGGAPLDCTPLGGRSTDFNLMLRRGAWQGAIEVVSDDVRPGSTPAGVCLVLAGIWRHGERTGFLPGHGVWWSERLPQPQSLIPHDPAQAALAWIALAPDAAARAASSCPCN
ncbi:histidine utilization protein HutD [Paracidovorax cattleyae]|nr:histidine utilization protein HutD [Paracidovorax cattleyae]